MGRRKRKMRGAWLAPAWGPNNRLSLGDAFGSTTYLEIALVNNRGEDTSKPSEMAQPIYCRRVVGQYDLYYNVNKSSDVVGWCALRLLKKKVAVSGEYEPDQFSAADAQVGHGSFLWQKFIPVAPLPLGEYISGYLTHPWWTTIDWKGIVKLEADERLALQVDFPAGVSTADLDWSAFLRTYVQYPGTRY